MRRRRLLLLSRTVKGNVVSGYFPLSYGSFLVLPQALRAPHTSLSHPTFVSLIRSRAIFDLTKRACKFLKPASPASATGADACIRLYLALQRVLSQRCASLAEELALSARELAA